MASKYTIADGAVFKQGTTTIPRVRNLTLFGETRNEINVSSVDNAEVETFILTKLKTISDVSFSVGLQDMIALSDDNMEHSILFPGVGTYTFWGQIKSKEPVQAGPGAEVLCNVAVKVTNLNATEVETAPAWVAAT